MALPCTRKHAIFHAEGCGLPCFDPAEVQSVHWDASLHKDKPQNEKKKIKMKVRALMLLTRKFTLLEASVSACVVCVCTVSCAVWQGAGAHQCNSSELGLFKMCGGNAFCFLFQRLCVQSSGIGGGGGKSRRDEM